ncbi:hypothetical protein Dimus_004714 [Dionaea muscipula]
MNSSDFKDKQVMDLSKSKFYDSDESEEDDGNRILAPNMDYQIPSSDFRRIRPSGSSNSLSSGLWNSTSMDHMVSAKGFEHRSGTSNEAMLISKISETIKEHVEDLLHAIEGVSARVTQLESKERHLEQTMYDLKGMVEFVYAGTEVKLRHLENIMGEVHAGVQFMSDKQEIAEAKHMLEKLQLSGSKVSKLPSENQNADVQTISGLLAASNTSTPPQASLPYSSSPSLSHLDQPHPLVYYPDYVTSLPLNSSPSHQNPPPQPPLQSAPQVRTSSTSRTPHGNIPNLQFPYLVNQQYHLPIPSSEVLQPPPVVSHEPFPFTAYNPRASQLTEVAPVHPSHLGSNAQYQSPSTHRLVEMPYVPSNGYPLSIQQSLRTTRRTPSSEPLHLGSSQSMIRSNADSPEWRFSNNTRDPDYYHEYGSSHLSSRTKDDSRLLPPINQSQLTTRKPLQYALPIASSSGPVSGSGGTEDKVSFDDVVEKITTMGFRRDLVREAARKLKDGGQPVDLNAVLDKLMSHKELQVQRVER